MARILIGNIKGPKGDTGPKGATGAIGPVGPQGPLPPLTNNFLATVPGVSALDAVAGKTLKDEIDLVNSDIALTDYATFTNANGWSVNQGTDSFSRSCKIAGNIVYMSAPVTSYTSVAANTSVVVATLSKAPSTIQTITGRHTSASGSAKGIIYGYINRGGDVAIYSTSAIVSGDIIYVKSIPDEW